MPPRALTEDLYRLLQRPISAADRHRAARHVLDWVGCALGGRGSAAGQALDARAMVGGAGPCVLLASGGTGSALDAAFSNGGLGNILEMDDIHRTSILHPGPVVIPAALAAAQTFERPAEAFLDAVIRGYETTIRIGRAAGPGHYANFHATATCGSFGAAAAVSDILGLEEADFASALGNAGSTAGGLWRCRLEPAMTKQWHNGIAAQNGLRAAVAARAGLTGIRHVLEGAEGFFATLCAGGADPARVLAEPEAAWLIHETSFKPWPSCRHTHPAVDAALLAHQRGIALGDIAAIRLATYGDAVRFCDQPRPQTEGEAKFSLQHVVALCLMQGRPTLDDFAADRLNGSDLAGLRNKVQVELSPEIEAAYPAHYGASLTLTLHGGARHVFTVRDALGDPENPMSDQMLRAKAESLFAHAGREAAGHAARVTATLALADGGSLAAFTAALMTR